MADPLGVRRTILLTLAVVLSLTGAGSALAAAHLGDRTLRSGAHGQDVRSLQTYLRRDGYRVTLDGQFGPGTLKAVRSFQRAFGLPVTGVVNAKTVAALRAGPSGGAAAAAPATTTALSAAQPPPAPAPAPSGTASAGQATLQDGNAVAPAGAPAAVVAAIAAANRIDTLPYRYGGGHAQWEDTAYDCSGAVGYALHAAGLITTTMTSGELAKWGEAGPGQWITIYANADHTWVVIAGLRFDTARYDTGATVSETGPRWRSGPRPTDGFVVRHPAGL